MKIIVIIPFYNFIPRFWNPGGARDKRGAGGLAGYLRRTYLVPIPEAESLEIMM